MSKINIDIYGSPKAAQGKSCGGCGQNGSHQGGCSGCGSRGISIGRSSQDCGCRTAKESTRTLENVFDELKEFINDSDIADFVNLNLFDLDKINILDYDDIRILTEREFEPPYTIIDGIVRYYGGISKELIYKDVKDLLS